MFASETRRCSGGQRQAREQEKDGNPSDKYETQVLALTQYLEFGLASAFVDTDTHFTIGIGFHGVITTAAIDDNFRKENPGSGVNRLIILVGTQDGGGDLAVVDITALGDGLVQRQRTGLQLLQFLLEGLKKRGGAPGQQ